MNLWFYYEHTPNQKVKLPSDREKMTELLLIRIKIRKRMEKEANIDDRVEEFDEEEEELKNN